jgi:hypothetical protein
MWSYAEVRVCDIGKSDVGRVQEDPPAEEARKNKGLTPGDCASERRMVTVYISRIAHASVI